MRRNLKGLNFITIIYYKETKIVFPLVFPALNHICLFYMIGFDDVVWTIEPIINYCCTELPPGVYFKINK